MYVVYCAFSSSDKWPTVTAYLLYSVSTDETTVPKPCSDRETEREREGKREGERREKSEPVEIANSCEQEGCVIPQLTWRAISSSRTDSLMTYGLAACRLKNQRITECHTNFAFE